jgi:exonuclease VII large subunit
MKFDEINARIQRETEERLLKQANEVPAKPTNTPTGMVGMQVAKPGTERTVLDATNFQLMECETAMVGSSKRRFTVVEKNVRATYNNQFVTSAGERAHVITKDLFDLLYGVLNSAGKQLNDLRRDNAHLQEQRDLYRGTIDALRKNGIIE